MLNDEEGTILIFVLSMSCLDADFFSAFLYFWNLTSFDFVWVANAIKILGKLYFIDFEYGSYSYRGYDIANHFNEWAGTFDASLAPSDNASRSIDFDGL